MSARMQRAAAYRFRWASPDQPVFRAALMSLSNGCIPIFRPSLRVEVSAFNKRDTNDIDHAITTFAALPNGGLILTAGANAR